MSIKENVRNIVIPEYSPSQEMFNLLSHVLGLPLAIAIFTISLFKKSQGYITNLDLVGLIIFAVSAFLVYLVSSVYHGMRRDSFAKKVLRVIDHCMIYLLIAGTYTPVCLAMLDSTILGVIMLIIEWVGAAVGIVLNAFFFNSKVARIISFAFYIIMGWLCAFCCGWLYIPLLAFLLILIGGIVYSIGSILYAVGKANKWFHSIFHIFVLVGTIVQTVGVFLLN